MKPLLIYTVVTGGYDVPCDVQHSDVADFVCLTDGCDCAKGWRHILTDQRQPTARLLADQLRWNPPWELLYDYEYVLRIDARVSRVSPEMVLVAARSRAASALLTFKHPERPNVFDEIRFAATVPPWRDTVAGALKLYSNTETPCPVMSGGAVIFKPREASLFFNKVYEYMLSTGCSLDQAVMPAAARDTLGCSQEWYLDSSHGHSMNNPMWQFNGRHVACPRHAGASRQPSLSIVIPTINRTTLDATFLSLVRGGISASDEVLVASEYPEAEARCVKFASTFDLKLRFFTAPDTKDFGNIKRNLMLPLVSGDYVVCIDDDDEYAEGAITRMRQDMDRHAGSVLLYRMRFTDGRTIWRDKNLVEGNISTQLAAVPSGVAARCRFGLRHAGDFDYIKSAVELCGKIQWIDYTVLKPYTPSLGKRL